MKWVKKRLQVVGLFFKMIYVTYTQGIHVVIRAFIVCGVICLCVMQGYTSLMNTRAAEKYKNSWFKKPVVHDTADVDRLYEYYQQEKEAYKWVTGKDYSTRKIVD